MQVGAASHRGDEIHMALHHLNCGTMHPKGQRLLFGHGSFTGEARIVTHCLLVETGEGLVLVDSGLGLEDVADPVRRLGRLFVTLARPQLDPDEAAVRHVVRLGYGAEDVTHVVLTHLDVDHAGGLSDFPNATVHVLRAELDAASGRRSVYDRFRFRPAQWAHGPKWEVHEPTDERFEGFVGVSAVVGRDVLMLPVPGHSPGHAAVAVRHDGGWLLHCGDAYFDCREISLTSPRCPPGLAVFQRLVAADNAARLRSQRRLREAYHRSDALTACCSHDPEEFEALSQRATAQA